MSRICPLFSGSTGNSTYIGTQNGGILVDAGASFKGLCNALERAGGSAVMRRKVETVAFTQSFAEQQKQIEEACAAIWEQFFLAAEKMDLFSIMNG